MLDADAFWETSRTTFFLSLACFFSSCLTCHISLAIKFGKEAGSSEDEDPEEEEDDEELEDLDFLVALTATGALTTAGFPWAARFLSLLCFFSSCFTFHISLAMIFGKEAGSSEDSEEDEDEAVGF